MLTQRQQKIFNMFVESLPLNKILTSTLISDNLNVTTRTIRTDISEINSSIQKYDMQIKTIPGKGYLFVVNDKNKMNEYLELELLVNNALNENTNDSKEKRIQHLIGILISSNIPTSTEELSHKLYISRSQLSVDLKEAKQTLSKYDLKICSKNKNGFIIEGTEKNKRICITRENINIKTVDSPYGIYFSREELSNIVISAITKYHYKISDLSLQNLILHIDTSIIRILSNNTVESENDCVLSNLDKEIEIAREIYSVVEKRIQNKVSNDEILFLALNLQSKSQNIDNDAIDKTTNDFIVELFNIIKMNYGIDFSSNIELRLNLGMHIPALIMRARNNFMMKNAMLAGIKQSFTLAYDIGVLSANVIKKRYNVSITEDEIGYLAIYFNMELSDNIDSCLKANVLILTNLRKSEMLLFKYNFTKYFKKHIKRLDVVNVCNIDYIQFNDYDIVFTTLDDCNFIKWQGNLIKIDYFLNNKDIMIIEDVFDKFEKEKSILNYFLKDCFFAFKKEKNKSEVLKMLCCSIEKKTSLEKDLYESVKNREKLGSTYFGNGVALAHPDCPISTKTIISVGVLDKPIQWDKKDTKVSIIFLIAVRKNGENDMKKVYEFLSYLISNKKLLRQLKETPTYDCLASIADEFSIKEL